MRPYPAYKDSGVEWFPEIPEHWEVWKLAHAVPVISSGTTPSTENPAYYLDGEIPWVNTGDLNDATLQDCAKRVTELAVMDHSPLKLYPIGSVVIALYGATIGKLGILGFSACVNQACCVLSPSGGIDSRYLFFWLLGFRNRIITLASGGGQPNISQEIVRSLRLALPPLPEQQAIARFLDKEVAKIDALVAEQRRLIALLAEKRQAVISHTVTKGLNPATPLKPSGIDWLGDIPEGWEVVPLKHVTLSRCDGPFGSGLKSEHYSDAGVRVIRLQNIKLGAFAGEDEAFVDEEYASTALAGHDVESGDLLLAGLGDDRNPVGRCCVAPDDIAPALVKADCFRFRVDHSRVKPLFVALQLSASAVRDAGVLATGTTRSRIPLTVMANRCLALPPPSEQEAIVTKLLEIQAQFDALSTTAQSAISLLQERRAALISAAVTGKIDLRPHFAQSLSEPETA